MGREVLKNPVHPVNGSRQIDASRRLHTSSLKLPLKVTIIGQA
jgi:hypothetical protein